MDCVLSVSDDAISRLLFQDDAINFEMDPSIIMQSPSIYNKQLEELCFSYSKPLSEQMPIEACPETSPESSPYSSPLTVQESHSSYNPATLTDYCTRLGSDYSEFTNQVLQSPVEYDQNVNLQVSPAEDSENEQRPKKKRKKNELRGNTSVSLSREQLLTISSQELEQFAESVSAVRKLTPEELKELRIQRRLVKNREYAQSSRKKKKSYVGELEAQITELKKENEILKNENIALKQKLRVKDNTGNITDHVPTFSTINPLPNNGGTYLFILLLSFGMLFSFSNISNSNFISRQTYSTGRVLLDFSERDTWWFRGVDYIKEYFSSPVKDSFVKIRSNEFVAHSHTLSGSSFLYDVAVCNNDSLSFMTFQIPENQPILA